MKKIVNALTVIIVRAIVMIFVIVHCLFQIDLFGIFTKYYKICGCSKDEYNQDYFHYIVEDFEEDTNKLKTKNSENNIQLSKKINEIKHNKNLLIYKYK